MIYPDACNGPSAETLAKMPEWMRRYAAATPEAAALRLAYLKEADARTKEHTR